MPQMPEAAGRQSQQLHRAANADAVEGQEEGENQMFDAGAQVTLCNGRLQAAQFGGQKEGGNHTVVQMW